MQDEPLCANVNVINNAIEEDWSRYLVQCGYSVKALNSDGRIIGVFMNHLLKKDEDEDESPITDEKLMKIITLLEHCKQRIDLFQNYPDTDKIIDANILSVDPDYRGLGVGQKLLLKTMEHAKSQKFPYCYVLCSSYFTSQICKKLEFTQIFSLAYKDYLVNGEQVFTPPSPHTDIIGYIKST